MRDTCSGVKFSILGDAELFSQLYKLENGKIIKFKKKFYVTIYGYAA